jgi:hypothetical protein
VQDALLGPAGTLVKTCPGDPEGWVARAAALARLGRSSRCAQQPAAPAANPPQASAHTCTAVVDVCARRRAIEDLQVALGIEPRHAAARKALADVSLYDSTFSRTVLRLYGGAKGLVM